MSNTDIEKFIINEIDNEVSSDILKAIMILDMKKLIESKIVCSKNKYMYLSNPFERIMHYFATSFQNNETKDLESREISKEIYKKLGWNQEVYTDGKKYYDIINSFWNVYICATAIVAKKLNNNNPCYYFDKNTVKIKNYDYFFKKEKYASKYLELPGNKSGTDFFLYS